MNLLSPQITERLGWTLVHFVWQATAAALLLAVTLRLLHKASSSVRYIVSCLALVLIAVLPVVTMQLVEVSGSLAEVGPTPTPLIPPVEVTEATELPPMVLESSVPQAGELAVRALWRQRVATVLEPTLPYLVLGWLVGVFGLSAWHLGGWAQLQRLRQRMVHDVTAPLQTRLGQLAQRLRVRRAVVLLESALVEVPTVVGWIKPVILLPASALTGLNTEQLEAVLAHELAHIRRYDYLVNIAQTVVEILGFFHPALWWVSHKIRDERENCCDDLAVRVYGDSVRYAKALTHLEAMRHRGAELALAATGGSLIARISRIVGLPAPARNRFAWLPGIVALLLVAGIVIPAALVLAEPDLPQNKAPAIEGPISGEGNEMSEEPKQVLMNFTVVEVPSDGTLDRDPLLTGEEAKAFTDLLIAQGQGKVLSRSAILTQAGRQAQIIIGEDPNRVPANTAEKSNAFRLSLDVTPTVKDTGTIVLSLAFRVENFSAAAGNAAFEAVAVDFSALVTLRNRQYAMFSLPVADRNSDRADGRPATFLLLVKPTIAEADANEQVASETGPKLLDGEAPALGGTKEESEKPAVEIGTRLLSVGDAFMDALGQGPSLAGVTSPADVNALHEIARRLTDAGQTTLDAAQLGLLLKAVQSDKDSRALASPRVTVLAGESAQIAIGDNLSYTDSYSESNDGLGQPVPNVKEARIGLEMTMTPSLLTDGRIGLEVSMTLTNVEGYEEKTYKGTWPYRVPKIDKLEFPMKGLSIPDGETVLIAGPRAGQPLNWHEAAVQEPAGPLLILFTVKQAATDRSDP
jgi:beta-lactamase regulating signal transducer with metallopeptidase domain/Flp pilus assembly secretin CpaC